MGQSDSEKPQIGMEASTVLPLYLRFRKNGNKQLTEQQASLGANGREFKSR